VRSSTVASGRGRRLFSTRFTARILCTGIVSARVTVASAGTVPRIFVFGVSMAGVAVGGAGVEVGAGVTVADGFKPIVGNGTVVLHLRTAVESGSPRMTAPTL
jgi:hypothetical protein